MRRSRLDRTDIRHLADLARLEIDEPDREALALELSRLADAIDGALAERGPEEEIDEVEDPAPPRWRDDVPEPFADACRIVVLAPERRRRHVVVPRIFEK